MAFDIFMADTLQRWGFMDFILPFVLIFTIVFAILQKVKIFGDKPETRKFNVVVALVMGLAVVVPHSLGMYPPNRDIVNIINQSLPNVSVVLVAILMGLLIIGLLGKRVELGGGSLSGWIAILAFVVVVWIFGSAANWWQMPAVLWFLADPDLQSLVIVILVFSILIWFVTHEPKKEGDTGGFGKDFSELLKGP